MSRYNLRSHSRRPKHNIHWASLPAEIQYMLLEHLVDVHHDETGPTTGLAAYAAVCQSWQLFFERRIFRHFTIQPPDIPIFDRITTSPNRRGLVNHVLLQFTVVGINGGDGQEFTCAIRDVLNVLSSWGIQKEQRRSQGLTLELGARTPETWPPETFARRTKLYSKFLEGCSPELCSYSQLPLQIGELGFAARCFNNPPPDDNDMDMWNHCKHILLGRNITNLNPNLMAHNTLHGSLQRATIVTRFLVRLEHYPNLSPRALGKIIRRLPCLEEIHLERWGLGYRRSNRKWDSYRHRIFEPSVADSLKRLTIFEETDTAFHRQRRYLRPQSRPGRRLPPLLLNASYQLEHLAVSGFVTATSFYREFEFQMAFPGATSATGTAPSWPCLRSLALTSRELTSMSSAEVTKLLISAASAARTMPQLQTLEIWGHADGEMAIFRYCRTESTSKIEWQGTLQAFLGADVLEAWNEVVSIHSQGRHRLQATTIRFSEKAKTSASILQHLHLRELIIHGVSADQLEKEFMPVE